MTVAAGLLQRSRIGASLTQAALGTLARIPQSSIARAESGDQGLTVATLDRLVRAAGFRLTVIPTRGVTAADAAESVVEYLATHNEDGPYRSVIQLADDLAREHGAERVALTVTPPQPTGDIRYDAFIAGVVETRLDEERLPHPVWLATAARLNPPWFVDPWSTGDPPTIEATPDPLRERGVIIDAAELVSA